LTLKKPKNSTRYYELPKLYATREAKHEIKNMICKTLIEVNPDTDWTNQMMRTWIARLWGEEYTVPQLSPVLRTLTTDGLLSRYKKSDRRYMYKVTDKFYASLPEGYP